MQNDFSHMINAVMKNLDWEMVLGVHKMFNKGVGCEPMIIPGVKRKPYSEELTIKDLKHELKSLLKMVISKGSSEVNYGLWIISWYNSEDEKYIEFEDEEGEFEEDGIEFQPWFPTKLSVVLAPQIINVVENVQYVEDTTQPEQTPENLEHMLAEAIKKEDYELANKLKDVISHKSKTKNKEDK